MLASAGAALHCPSMSSTVCVAAVRVAGPPSASPGDFQEWAPCCGVPPAQPSSQCFGHNLPAVLPVIICMADVQVVVAGHTARQGERLAVDAERADAAAGTAALFAAHHTRMLRAAAVLLPDPAAAEDVVQDAYVAIYSAWGRIRDRDAAVGYPHRSVVNGARSRLRHSAVAQRHLPLPPVAAKSAEDTALAGFAGGPLVRALRALPRREREVVLLRHYLDLSEQQTADALGLRLGSVKAYGSRGLATLRSALSSGGQPLAGHNLEEHGR